MASSQLLRNLTDLIDKTPIADTHEHLLEESSRTRPITEEDRRFSVPTRWRLRDFSIYFSHYMDSDLVVAGMPEADLELLWSDLTPPEKKWALIKPFWEKSRNTGYALNVRESLFMLHGERDIHDGNWRKIDEAVRAAIKPGYYRAILKDHANIDHAQVNSLEVEPFCETEQPDLLLQDIAFSSLSNVGNIPRMESLMDREIATIDDWEAAIAWAFTTYGPRAVAAKSNAAYLRRLDYDDVPKEAVRDAFARFAKDPSSLKPVEWKALSDYSFNESVRQATAQGLPVKLHTGYYAGHNGMPLERLKTNASDMCDLLRRHPKTLFVMMHITYPYQDEAIAVAKHYANATIDMCWAWIVNPAAGVRFLKEFLMAAPSNKVFTFGADYGPVELVPGHARIARRGIARALFELVDEGWLAEEQLEGIVERLMLGNAYEWFPIGKAKAAWKK